jgi:hypothetical protein
MQATLGDLIDAFEALDPDFMVSPSFEHPHSYRGYYAELALEEDDGPTRAGDLLEMLHGANGSTYTGGKGGDFVMDRSTPVWLVLEEGMTGRPILGFGLAVGDREDY